MDEEYQTPEWILILKELKEKSERKSFKVSGINNCKMDIPYYHQEKLYTCGASATRMVLEACGIKKTEEKLIGELGITKEDGVTLEKIKEFFDNLDLSTKLFNHFSFQELCYLIERDFVVIVFVNRFVYDTTTPKVRPKVKWENEKVSNHFVVITKIKNNMVYFNDPHIEVGQTSLSKDKFIEASNGSLLAIKKEN